MLDKSLRIKEYGLPKDIYTLQEITIELLKDAMLKHSESPGFLIDGFPRELDQGYQFEQEVMY